MFPVRVLFLARAASASAMYTFYDLALLQFRLGHSANAIGCEIGVPGLDAAETTEVFVSLLLPLGDQVAVRDFVLDAVLVKL